MATGQFLPATDDITEVHFDTDTKKEVPRTDAEQKTDDLSSALRDDQASFVTIHQELGGRSIHVERIAADKYDVGQLLDYLASNYGGGDYRVRVYANGKLTANKLMSIASKLKKENEHTLNAPNTGSEVAQSLQAFMHAMAQQNQQMIELMQNNKPDEMEMLNKMMMYKQLFASENSGASNGISQLKESIEVMGSLGIQIGGPTEEKDSGFTDLIEKLAPVMGAAMQQQPHPQRPQRPQPNPNQQKSDNPMFGNMMFKGGINLLIGAAKKNAHTMTYAEMIFDHLDEDKIREFITAPDAALKLQKFAPETAKHAAWFDDLAEHVKAQLGMKSKYSDLYQADDGVITAETQKADAPSDTDIPTDGNPQRG